MSYYIVCTLYKGGDFYEHYYYITKMNIFNFIIMNILLISSFVLMLKTLDIAVISVKLNLSKILLILLVPLSLIFILLLKMQRSLFWIPILMSILSFLLWLLLRRNLKIIRSLIIPNLTRLTFLSNLLKMK